MLELFHGPTAAFKDVGASFLARLLPRLPPERDERPLTVLVATSGLANENLTVSPGTKPRGTVRGSFFQRVLLHTLAMVIIALWIVLALAGLGLLMMLLFGIRSLTYGKIKPVTLVIVITPVILLLVLGFVLGDWSTAAIFSVFIMLGLASLSLLVTGLQGLFT